jgi:hypothetical protein
MTMTARVPAPMYTASPLELEFDSHGPDVPCANRPKTPGTARKALRPRSLSSMEDRERRIAENEAYWRQVNELSPPEPGMLNSVFCECGRLECSERIPMTAAEYEVVRSRSTTFVVAPGHEQIDVERVIETTDRFRIVQKEGAAAEVAMKTDPN